MIKRIYVHNYRTFVNFEWIPPQICALVGENGSGKSALIEIFWLLQDVLLRGARYEATGYPETRTAWIHEPEQKIELDLDIAGAAYRYELTYAAEHGRGSIGEALSVDGAIVYRSVGGRVELFGDEATEKPRTSIDFEPQRSFLSFLEPRVDNRKTITFREYFRRVWAIKPDPLRLGAVAQAEAQSLDPNLSNFADWYRGRIQENPDAGELLRADLRSAIPGFQSLRLEPVTPSVKELRAKFQFGQRSYELAWSKLSDGQRLLISLYGLLRFALDRAAVIALDEVENYLSPAEIQPWLRAVVDSASRSGAQTIVASHNSEAIEYIAADVVWRLSRDSSAGHTRINRLEPDRDAGESAYELVKRLQSYG